MTRKRGLPEGWYPSQEIAVRRLCDGWATEPADAGALACVAPHAGWSFSGRLACAAVASLRGGDQRAETVVIVGGHLPHGGGIFAAEEEGYTTPLGDLAADLPLLERLRARLPIRADHEPDNGVEIQLPFVRYHLGPVRALWLRVAPSREAILLGEALFEAAFAMGRSLRVVGSTDLTHYGPAYHYLPRGGGEAAVRWVTEVSDRRMIGALLSLDGEAALALGSSERSACSAGGAVAALTFARLSGAENARLIGHFTSYELHPSESFVGYAGIAYSAER